MTTLHFNNIVSPRVMHRYEWFLDGTRGSACASQSELVISLKAAPDQRQIITLHGRWLPDAFDGSMGGMLSALAEEREPATSGRDHLRTLRIAFAAVESAKTAQTVELATAAMRAM